MAAEDDKTPPEQTPNHRAAIASQLRYVANKIEAGSLTGFSLVWDGQAPIIAGEGVQDVGRMLEIKIAEQKAQIRAYREALAAQKVPPPAAEEPDTSKMN